MRRYRLSRPSIRESPAPPTSGNTPGSISGCRPSARRFNSTSLRGTKRGSRDSSFRPTTSDCARPPRPRCRRHTTPSASHLPPYDMTPRARAMAGTGSVDREMGRPGWNPQQAVRDLGIGIELDRIAKKWGRTDPRHSQAISPCPADYLQDHMTARARRGNTRGVGSGSSWPSSSRTWFSRIPWARRRARMAC